LDNLEDEEKEIGQEPGNKSTDDIQFDEAFDIDKLQVELQEKIDKGDVEEEEEDLEFEEKPETTSDSETIKTVANFEPQVDSDANAKKYVVYVSPDNVDFMESLSANERKIMINKILKEQNEQSIISKEAERRRKFISNLMIVTFTAIIGFPVMFFIVNKGLELTMTNYNTAKQNFTKLYKQKGKIKPVSSEAIQNFKY
jgi:hypothetical protein